MCIYHIEDEMEGPETLNSVCVLSQRKRFLLILFTALLNKYNYKSGSLQYMRCLQLFEIRPSYKCIVLRFFLCVARKV